VSAQTELAAEPNLPAELQVELPARGLRQALQRRPAREQARRPEMPGGISDIALFYLPHRPALSSRCRTSHSGSGSVEAFFPSVASC